MYHAARATVSITVQLSLFDSHHVYCRVPTEAYACLCRLHLPTVCASPTSNATLTVKHAKALGTDQL